MNARRVDALAFQRRQDEVRHDGRTLGTDSSIIEGCHRRDPLVAEEAAAGVLDNAQMDRECTPGNGKGNAIQ